MNYPSGDEIKICDDVVFDEGEAYGYVLGILETDDDIKSYGLDCQSLILGLMYPKVDWNYISYPQHILAREGFRKQSKNEMDKISEVIQKAGNLTDAIIKRDSAAGLYEYSIRCPQNNDNMNEWIVSVFRNRNYLESVVIEC